MATTDPRFDEVSYATMAIDYWADRFTQMSAEAAQAMATGGLSEVYETEGNIWDEVAKWAEEDEEKLRGTAATIEEDEWEEVPDKEL